MLLNLYGKDIIISFIFFTRWIQDLETILYYLCSLDTGLLMYGKRRYTSILLIFLTNYSEVISTCVTIMQTMGVLTCRRREAILRREVPDPRVVAYIEQAGFAGVLRLQFNQL